MDYQPKVALGLICAPTDREAELMDRLLSGDLGENLSNVLPHQKQIDFTGVDSLAKNVDAIYITITGENAKCEEVAKKYSAIVSHYKWDKNFANARKFNFSQIPEEYEFVYWADADDVIVHPERIKVLAKKMYEGAWDAMSMRYFYDHDDEGNCITEHLKTRLVKNDGCVEWMAAVHEDFKMNREISGSFNDEVRHIHLTDPKRIAASAERNKEIAELEVFHNPKDPHTYWNLANTYSMIGKHEEAINIYLQFLQISESDEERFLAWQRLASSYTSVNKWDYAIEAALEALNLRPWYPDPYLLLGELNYNIGKLRAARDFLEIGTAKPIPEFESIVWNPMDYTYNPQLILGQIYASMHMHRKALESFKKCLKFRPKSKFLQDAVDELEKGLSQSDIAEEVYKKASEAKNLDEVKKILSELPEDMKYYPPIVSLRNQYFIKEESSGKDVAIYCDFTIHEWNPEVFRNTGVGGSEEAIVQLAKRFAKAGFNVTVYCSTPKMQDLIEDGVTWKPWIAWNYRDKFDITIIWRHPKLLDYPINSTKIYLDIHDVIGPEEFTTARLLKTTKVLFKSKTQRDYYDKIPDDKCLIIPHGLDIEAFEEERGKITKNPYYILNTSSPDRGMKTFMKIVKMAYDKLPDDLKPLLKADQFYGFDIWDVDFSDNEKMIEWKADALEKMNELIKLGIMSPGSGKRISQVEVIKKYLEAGVLMYPSEFAEIGYIGGIKGMLAGCIPFTTNVFAQGEFAKEGVIVDSKITYKKWLRDLTDGNDYGVQEESQINEFVDKLVEYIKDPSKYNDMRSRLVEYAKESFNWDTTADLWVKEFNAGRE